MRSINVPVGGGVPSSSTTLPEIRIGRGASVGKGVVEDGFEGKLDPGRVVVPGVVVLPVLGLGIAPRPCPNAQAAKIIVAARSWYCICPDYTLVDSGI